MKCRTLLICFISVFTIGCQNSLDDTLVFVCENVGNDNQSLSFQDETLKNVALTINKAMSQSVEFRQVIKQMANLKFDGDYDVLLSQMLDKQVSDFAAHKGDCSIRSVADIFDELYPITNKSSFQDNILNSLAEMYPDMQISVPINIDKWEDGYIPVVVFVDSNFDERKTKYVQGFNENGDIVWVDAVNVPDMPVIVVGFNERMGSNIVEQESATRVTPPIGGDLPIIPPSGKILVNNFVATLEGGFIRLSWNIVSGTPFRTIIFCSENGGDYVQIGSVTGAATSYIFNDVDVNTSYSFYISVMGLNQGTFKTQSVSVTTGNEYIAPLVSFNASPINDEYVMLTWEQNSATNNDYVQIYRKLLSDNSETGIGTLVASIANSNIYMWEDGGGYAGNKYLYTAVNAKDGCVSNHRYDTVWKPYRNCSQADSVYIKRISYDVSHKSDIESWLYGAPEFRVSVHTIPGETTTPSTRVNNKFFYFSSEDESSHTFNSGNYLFSWLPSTTYDCMTIHMTEWDRESTNNSISLSVSVGMKTTLGDNIEFPLNATINLTINEDDIPIGLGHTYYFESPNETILLENYGFAVTLSNTNVNTY